MTKIKNYKSLLFVVGLVFTSGCYTQYAQDNARLDKLEARVKQAEEINRLLKGD